MNEPKSAAELEITDTERADIWKKLTERRLSKIPAQSHALFFEEEVDDVPAVFCELDQYVITDKKENIGRWQESTRWVKFQEVLDEEGKRWSKPHLPVISANALFQLKEYFYYGSVFFDVHAESITDVIDLFITELTKTGQLKDENGPLVRQILLRRQAKNTTKNEKKEQPKSNIKDLELLLTERTRKENKRLQKKLPEDVEATNILVGKVDFLDKPFIAFARLREAKVLGNLTEIDIPTKFVFVALAPRKGDLNAFEVGRALGTLMSDELFRRIIYRTNANEDLKVAISEYIHNATILPPCSLDPQTRIEPAVIVTEAKRKDKVKHLIYNLGEETDDAIIFDHFEDPSLVWTGRFAGGLISDIKRKAKWYLSDFTDGLNIESVSTFCFMYFALLSPIVTFGGLLEEATHKRMAAMENLFSGAICGIIYHLCSGQPLTIIGSTGPVLVFETIVYDLCSEFGWDYLSFRTWINFWTALFLLIITLTDSSASVKYITRFTEESFAALIAFIFIYEAFAKLIKIKDNLQIATLGGGDCECLLKDGNVTANISDCISNSGTYIGDDCYVLYDKFLMSIILMFGTFILSIALKKMRLSGYLPTRIREVVSDFAVIIAIALMTSADIFVGINTPKLTMPSTFTPTFSGRGWLIPPFGTNPYYTAAIAAVPAVLSCILIFLDQQITAVIVNRKEYKLRKGSGYHLDLFVLSILILITGYLGLPIYVAATVLSINHVTSLKVETEASAPGEPQQFLGVREQRLTGVMTFILIGVSVFMSKILCYIPMPVLYGVFLYMGINALGTLDFFERICLLLMPMKYQPDRQYIRHVPISVIHFFTLFQIICLGSLWAVKSIKKISILFPIMLLLMIFVRKFMEYIFSPRHLSYLDTPMPQLCGKKEEDDEEIDDTSSESSVEAYPQDKRKKYPFLYDSSRITRESSVVDETIVKKKE